MEKIINIGDKQIKMKATAGTMLRYRNNFGKDFMADLQKLQKKLNEKLENGTEFEAMDLAMFEQIAWCMAKTADDSIPDIEHWLDNFEAFDIMQVLPELMSLLVANMEQLSKKKSVVPENNAM